MISSALVAAIGKYSRQFPVKRIARSFAAAHSLCLSIPSPVPRARSNVQAGDDIGKGDG